ncbi:amino acid ABC transporter permease [Cohnella boryungensis]|uniref:Amino acid ABC transporter permease n=1 Tax=Cohnella boryungensis TaxID=768479 RepID=A0ABV8SGS1_9BACL
MSSPNKIPIWRNKKTIPWLLQLAFVLIIAALGAFLIMNALQGLHSIGLTLGFDFLKSTASFMITDQLIAYTPTDSFGRALLVGLMNTLKIAAIGIVFSGIIGTLVGIARMSDNWLLRKLAGGYIEMIRNIPLLVQIFFLYFTVFLPFPKIEQGINWLKLVYFSNRGTAIPWFDLRASWPIWLLVLAAGVGIAVWLYKSRLAVQIASGRRTYPMLWAAGLLLILIAALRLGLSEWPAALSLPSISGRLYEGGYVITSEFAAIMCGLILYHSAFIAEIVRSGIMSVPKGQIEAANALGLKKRTVMSRVILPQANRVAIPPATSQFLNLVKNSTLGVAVGYTELFSVGNTIINQTGRAVEIILLVASVYLIVSIIISFLMGLFNKHFQLIER